MIKVKARQVVHGVAGPFLPGKSNRICPSSIMMVRLPMARAEAMLWVKQRHHYDGQGGHCVVFAKIQQHLHAFFPRVKRRTVFQMYFHASFLTKFGAYFAASRIASTMLTALAAFFPAISKAVP